jgi:hypothetical protein
MNFSLRALFDRTPRMEDHVPVIITFETTISEFDEPEEIPQPTVEQGEDDKRYILEPMYMMIEYTDAKGTMSRRRITTQSAEDKPTGPILWAFCHERNAMRCFRIDRISSIIDQDGVVEEAQPFFAEVLGDADFEVKSGEPKLRRAPKSTDTSTLSAYTAARRRLTPALTLLVAAARSDDYLHPGEMEWILRFCEREAVACCDNGTLVAMPTPDDFDKLERTLRRLRPTRDEVNAALDALAAA